MGVRVQPSPERYSARIGETSGVFYDGRSRGPRLNINDRTTVVSACRSWRGSPSAALVACLYSSAKGHASVNACSYQDLTVSELMGLVFFFPAAERPPYRAHRPPIDTPPRLIELACWR